MHQEQNIPTTSGFPLLMPSSARGSGDAPPGRGIECVKISAGLSRAADIIHLCVLSKGTQIQQVLSRLLALSVSAKRLDGFVGFYAHLVYNNGAAGVVPSLPEPKICARRRVEAYREGGTG